MRDVAGAEVKRVVLDAGGFAFVELEPGSYSLEAAAVQGLMGTPAPQSVTVADGVGHAHRPGLRHRHPLADRVGAGATMRRMQLDVALVQLAATDDVAANIARAASLADAAATDGARLVALPEYLQYRGPDAGFRASAGDIPGPLTEPFAAIARAHGAWILLGSIAERSADPDRPYNTSVVIAPSGEIAATYRKVHLFDVDVERGPADTESARVTAGDDADVRRRRRRPARPDASATTCASRSCTGRWPWPAPRS